MSLVKEITLFDLDKETGELVPMSQTTKYEGTELGDDWIVLYKKALDKLLGMNVSGSTLKLFIKLLSMQDFGKEIVVSKKYLRESLQMPKSTFTMSLTWLKEHDFVKETTSMGNQAFVLNPKVTACGKKALKERKAFWSMSNKVQKIINPPS